jgi:hypothetical protein
LYQLAVERADVRSCSQYRLLKLGGFSAEQRPAQLKQAVLTSLSIASWYYMVPIIMKEGLEGLRGESCEEDERH